MKTQDSFPVIPDSEFVQRLQNFKHKMAENSIDLVAIYSNLLDPSAVRYFSDVSPINESAAMLIPYEGDPILCSGQACHAWSAHKSRVRDIRIMPEVGEVSGTEYNVPDQIDFEYLFQEMKRKYKVNKIGIVGDLIFPYEIFRKLEKVFPEAEKASAEKLLYQLRMVKSVNEIACMRKAAQIITETFEYAVPRIHPEVTELDIQADIKSQVLRLGAKSYCISFSPMIPSGPVNTHLCMNRNTLRRIQKGEILQVAGGDCYEGYNGVITTPVVLGKVPAEVKTAVNICRDAVYLLVQNMKPGASAKELYDLYISSLDKHGYRKYSPYAAVHTIGMVECEYPFFAPSMEITLAENMTVCIDAYFKGLPWGSFRIEDMFVIRKDGAEYLTHFNEKYIPTVFS